MASETLCAGERHKYAEQRDQGHTAQWEQQEVWASPDAEEAPLLKTAACSRNLECADKSEVPSTFINVTLKLHNFGVLVLGRNLASLVS